MNRDKKYIIVFCIMLLFLILFGVIIYLQFFSNNSVSDNLLISDKENNGNENIVDDTVIDSSEEDVIIEDSEEVYNNIKEEGNETEESEKYNSDTFVDSNTSNFSEDDIVSYFETMEVEVAESSSFKEKFKEYFITIVDFIFYDKEINGYTFNELSDMAKVKIISIALKIDNKIEEYIPNYKENISDTSGNIYNDIKEKLVTSYMDISTEICKNSNDDCAKVKDIFNEIKSVCKIGWDFLKSLLSNGVSKLKEWYEIYSGK